MTLQGGFSVAPVAYVLKRYPRYSETFVVNEILALEEAGVPIRIFSLRYPEDGHFQDAISRVRAPVVYLASPSVKANDLWELQREVGRAFPGAWARIEALGSLDARRLDKALRLALEIKRQGIGHLHAHFASEATVIARAAAQLADVPYSFTAHAKDIFADTVVTSELAERMRGASAVVTVSDFNVRYLGSRCPEASSNVTRIYNGLDLERFEYRQPANRPANILAVGRLVEKKGFCDLVDACAELRSNGERFTCDIAGVGPLEAVLREQIRDRGLEAHVRLLGARPQQELIGLIQRAAVLAAPCVLGEDGNRDGLPTVLLEAMALGTPCVSTDVTGIPEAIRHDDTGLCVPQRDPKALASALAALLGQPELRVRLAEAARRLIESDFDVRRNTVQLAGIFASGHAGALRKVASR